MEELDKPSIKGPDTRYAVTNIDGLLYWQTDGACIVTKTVPCDYTSVKLTCTTNDDTDGQIMIADEVSSANGLGIEDMKKALREGTLTVCRCTWSDKVTGKQHEVSLVPGTEADKLIRRRSITTESYKRSAVFFTVPSMEDVD